MTVGSTTSSSVASLRDRWQAFKDGSLTIQKSVLQNVKTDSDDAASFKKQLLESYDSIDKNGDGISFSELKTYTKSQAGGAGDPPPSLSKGDLTAMADQMTASGESVPASLQTLIDKFDNVDSDKDGKVSHEEADEFRKASGDANTGDADAVGAAPKHHGGCHGAHGGGKPMSKDELSAMADDSTSATGSVPTDLQRVIDNFDAADTDEDGKVSPAESQAFLQKSSGKTEDSRKLTPDNYKLISSLLDKYSQALSGASSDSSSLSFTA